MLMYSTDEKCTRMTHRYISLWCFHSTQQTLREKWVELQNITRQEKQLTRGEKKIDHGLTAAGLVMI